MVLEDIFEIIKDRKENGEDGWYTKYLFDKGTDKILKKVGEECTEVIIAAKGEDKNEIVNEICDLAYHVLVLMADKEITLEELNEQLKIRRKYERYLIKRKTSFSVYFGWFGGGLERRVRLCKREW